MKSLLGILSLSVFLYCAAPAAEINAITSSPKSVIPAKSYDSLKLEILKQKSEFLQRYTAGDANVLTEAGTYLDSMICEELFPHWKGTPWDFNGHTNEPNKGKIACGYLVSTLLKHSDFKLNRYKLAQQSSFNEIKTLAAPEAPILLGNSHEKALEKLKNMNDGLYILGLSYHVGFIRIKKGEVYFLHSTYLSPTAVVNEKAAESEAFIYSDVYYIGKISGNQELMKKWLKSSQISIFFD